MLKKISFLLIFIISNISSFAQSNTLIITIDEEEKFSVFINDVRQNIEALSAFKITDLKLETYEVSIVFESEWMKEIKKSIALSGLGTEYVYKIEQNKQGKYILKFISEEPIAEVQSKKNYKVLPYTSTPPNSPYTTTITTSEGTTISKTDSSNQKASFILKNYKGNYGCPNPMNEDRFTGVMEKLENKMGDAEKVAFAKQQTENSCLLTTQVHAIIETFSMESSRLDYAKYAYAYTLDIDNFHSLTEFFKEEESVNAINDFLRAKQKVNTK